MIDTIFRDHVWYQSKSPVEQEMLNYQDKHGLELRQAQVWLKAEYRLSISIQFWPLRNVQWTLSISFFQEWSGQSIPVGMEGSFHLGWNGVIPYLQEWNDTPFRPEWKDHSIPAGM